jgi:hypothetical protein
MARPETKDGTALGDRFGITEPIAHDGGTYRSSSGLEETKQKVYGKDKEISESFRDSFKVKPNGDVNQEQAYSGTSQTNGENSRRVEGIAEFTIDNITGCVSRHEDSVHLGQNQGRVTSILL